jgi:hypothetical protein
MEIKEEGKRRQQLIIFEIHYFYIMLTIDEINKDEAFLRSTREVPGSNLGRGIEILFRFKLLFPLFFCIYLFTSTCIY